MIVRILVVLSLIGCLCMMGCSPNHSRGDVLEPSPGPTHRTSLGSGMPPSGTDESTPRAGANNKSLDTATKRSIAFLQALDRGDQTALLDLSMPGYTLEVFASVYTNEKVKDLQGAFSKVGPANYAIETHTLDADEADMKVRVSSGAEYGIFRVVLVGDQTWYAVAATLLDSSPGFARDLRSIRPDNQATASADQAGRTAFDLMRTFGVGDVSTARALVTDDFTFTEQGKSFTFEQLIHSDLYKKFRAASTFTPLIPTAQGDSATMTVNWRWGAKGESSPIKLTLTLMKGHWFVSSAEMWDVR